MNYNGKFFFFCPLNLGSKRFLLLGQKCLVPIQVDTDFSNAIKISFVNPFFYMRQFFFVVFFYRSWMQSHHQENIFRVCCFQIEHAFCVRSVYSGNKKSRNTRIKSTFHHDVSIFIKLFRI